MFSDPTPSTFFVEPAFEKHGPNGFVSGWAGEPWHASICPDGNHHITIEQPRQHFFETQVPGIADNFRGFNEMGGLEQRVTVGYGYGMVTQPDIFRPY